MSIVNNILQNKINIHDALHGFIQGRETGMGNMEVKLAHQLAGIFHRPIFQVFIDMHKSYN